MSLYFNFNFDMGGSQTKQAATSSGAVNNNIVIDESVPIHNDYIVILLCIIAVVKVIELFMNIYYAHRRNLRKRYSLKFTPMVNTISSADN